jgi:hypothetical protein
VTRRQAFDHGQDITGVCGKFENDAIHQFVHEEQTETVIVPFIQAGMDIRFRYALRIKRQTLVDQADGQAVCISTGEDLDRSAILALVGMFNDVRTGFIDCRLDGIDGRVVKAGLGRLLGDEVTYFFQVIVTAWKNAMFGLQGRVG